MIDKNIGSQNSDHRDFLKELTPQDFLSFGMQDVAYIRPVESEGGEVEYAICAADGTALSVMDSMDSALVVTRHNDLEPLSLQ